MLQQTQVATVIPYFERFIAQLPNVLSLAHASEDEVLHLWSGLGYYSRARNLHKAAKIVVAEHDGCFPDNVESLELLPGIGRSTAGAICATAFEKTATILDGNVKRVLARHFAIEGWPSKISVSKQLWTIAESLTPNRRVRAYTQAIMDLGATVCTRSKPACDSCALQATCIAHADDAIAQYPERKPKKTLPVKSTRMLIIENTRGEVLLQRRPPVGIWGGLWSFPEQLETNETSTVTMVSWPVMRHTFSHFHLDITPLHLRNADSVQIAATLANLNTSGVSENLDSLWYNLHSPQKIGLAAPVNKLLNTLKSRQLNALKESS